MVIKKQADWDQLQQLFPQYLKNDSSVIELLFSTIQKALQGYFYTRMNSKEDAEDLAQATLLKIHFARDRFDTSKSLKTWVFTIASRSLIDHWRKSSHDLEDISIDDEANAHIADMAHLDLSPELRVQLQNDLNKALKNLKPIDRQIVYLYGVEEMSMAEIAQALNLTETAVKLRAHRAHKEMRQIVVGIVLMIVFLGVRYGRY